MGMDIVCLTLSWSLGTFYSLNFLWKITTGTAQHTPLIIAADPQYWCKQCRRSPPPSSLTLRHSIPPIKLQISFRTTTATSPLLCLGNSHTHIRPSLLKSQQWSKIGTTWDTATDPRNTLTHTPDSEHMATSIKIQVTKLCEVIWVLATGETGARHYSEFYHLPRHFSSKWRNIQKSKRQ